jgi:hypothetical protein
MVNALDGFIPDSENTSANLFHLYEAFSVLIFDYFFCQPLLHALSIGEVNGWAIQSLVNYLINTQWKRFARFVKKYWFKKWY